MCPLTKSFYYASNPNYINQFYSTHSFLHLLLIDTLHFSKSVVKDLIMLESIGEDSVFKNSNIKDLKNLKNIGGTAYIKHSEIKPSDFNNVRLENSNQEICLIVFLTNSKQPNKINLHKNSKLQLNRLLIAN